jgi:hypothetical protein
MPQRQLRLGDILDDYCPRERRITNHVIVAMIDQDIKQTRCTTCEAEHEYKQAKVPPQRKKKDAPGGLFHDVLTSMPRKTTLPSPPVGSPSLADVPGPEDPELQADGPGLQAVAEHAPAAAPGAVAPPADGTDEAEGPVHRQLIRATLPRPEGQPKERPIPEFTVRTATTARPGRFRPGRRPQAGGHDQTNGFGFRGRRGNSSGQGHHAPGAHGNRARPAHGERPGQPRRRGGKKRSK